MGVIINEVMCAGRPLVVPHNVGSVPDLVRHGINGRLMKSGDPKTLPAALQDILADPTRRMELGRQSLALVSDWSYEQCRLGLVKASQPA